MAVLARGGNSCDRPEISMKDRAKNARGWIRAVSKTRQYLEAFAENAEQTARREQTIQKNIDRADKAGGGSKRKPEAMQAGARAYPTSFPKQHLEKPGLEAELELRPMYQAPYYKG